jgi:SAM-dependent methyltransferase
MRFADTSLVDIIAAIRGALSRGEVSVSITVADPDVGRGHYAGARIEVGGVPAIHRPLRVWVDLADRLGLRLATPRADGEGWMRLRFEPLPADAAEEVPRLTPERYGAASSFARVSKLDDPSFVLDMEDALARTSLPPRPRILDLGGNTGDELALLLALSPALRSGTLVGVDHSASATAVARARFADLDATFHEADLHILPQLDVGRFDLVVSIGVLHSPGVDDRALLRHIVQERLTERGSVIFGYPNCRYRGGEVSYGARMKNFAQPELSLVLKDVAFCRRYLQQHRRKVYVTGKHYVLVTGVPLDAPNPRSR